MEKLTELLVRVAGAITLVGAVLYYTGYEILVGYYGYFGLPLSLVQISFNEAVLAGSAIWLFTALPIAVYVLALRVDQGVLTRARDSYRGMAIMIIIYVLFVAIMLPFSGKQLAECVRNETWGPLIKAYGYYAPKASLSLRTPLPGIPAEPDELHRFNYQDLRILRVTSDYVCLEDEKGAGFVIPKADVAAISRQARR